MYSRRFKFTYGMDYSTYFRLFYYAILLIVIRLVFRLS